jgi:flagellin
MVALQTLKSVNRNLMDTQSAISTGKTISSAKDNSAVWAISKVMEADVKGFASIQESLGLGEATVAVGRNAAETITELLTDIKGKIVAAQEDNIDRVKIQDDIERLRGQIDSVVGAAQFNGLNLVDGSQDELSVLSSLDRNSNGSVQSSSITLALGTTNLSRDNGDAIAGAALPGTQTAAEAGGTAAITAADFDFLLANGSVATGTVAFRPDDMTGPPLAAGLAAGDIVEMQVGDVSVNYTVRNGDTGIAILGGLQEALEGAGIADLEMTLGNQALSFTNNAAADGNANDLDITITATRGSGGLSALTSMNVTTSDATRTQALLDIEEMIDYSIDAAAAFGSAQGRIETQSNFVSKLMDSLKSGVGTLVDADMEAASARLQALQVQQQLATQSLSIANQAPQNILALFR